MQHGLMQVVAFSSSLCAGCCRMSRPWRIMLQMLLACPIVHVDESCGDGIIQGLAGLLDIADMVEKFGTL